MIRIARTCARLLGLGVLLLAALAHPVAVDANPTIASAWANKYSPPSASYNNAGCALCHDKAVPDSLNLRWNSYGRALRLALNQPTLAAAMTSIENGNADGDSAGASNLAEIQASTQPGWRAGSTNTLYDTQNAAVATNVAPPQNIGSVDPAPIAPTPSLSINDVTGAEGNSGTTPFVFTVSLSAASTSTVTVNFATADGTAKAGTDYQSTSGPLSFSPGQTSKTISVGVFGNTAVEADKTFTVNLSAPSNATIADGAGTGRIVNDDAAPVPSLSINDVTGAEGNSGATPFVFTVSLSAASTSTVTVNFATADGTAKAGTDYQSTSGPLSFSPGQTSKTISVGVFGNTALEADKTFTVNLSAPSNATIADGTGTGRIVNDDAAPAAPSLSINDVAGSEGNSGLTPFVFTVSLSSASTSTVTVNYATASGSATAGVDFVPGSGTLSIPPGVTSGSITVQVKGNTTVEGNRTFSVQLSGPVNAAIVDGQGVGTIIDDDTEGALNFQGLWWNAPPGSEAGWGINFAHQADVIFGSWFTYDLNGRGWWLVMVAYQTGANTFAGDVFEARGPPFNTVPFVPLGSPGGATTSPVGKVVLTFTDGNNGTFAYTVNGISQTKSITRQILGAAPLPVCVFSPVNNLAAATNYQDIWWAAPAASEDGWGINLTHQGATIFASWFTYDSDRAPMWLVVTALQTGPATYTGDLYRTTGPPFNAVPFPPLGSPGGPTATKVGTAAFTFVDGQIATFAYTVNGISQAKTITREVFRPPGTVCQ